MKLRKRKGDRTVPLDEPVDTGEEMVQREIAVWEDNPEQHYSREEIQENSGSRPIETYKTSVSNRFHTSVTSKN